MNVINLDNRTSFLAYDYYKTGLNLFNDYQNIFGC